MENNTDTLQNDVTSLVKENISKGINYQEYRELVAQHVEKGTSTGPNQSEELSNYTLLNHSRMKRLDKTTKVSESLEKIYREYTGEVTWLVITESWCGDAAQNLPIINKLAELNTGIDLKMISRDENPELMDAFLTNGAMAIPKLIAFDKNKNEVIGLWGPRPTVATQMVVNYKKEHGKLTPEFKKDLQVWYNKDKGLSTFEDLAELI
ncbi:MAG: hypothetical protein ACI9SJ_002348 [Flavobacteriaceae bacterium]|jgi:hypothetical protein|uniref:thioredoxin family protein n=1 Tax=Candidatus Marifrigoribacter sp. Uisw_064 TaxID=3230970 RepID=UPI003AEDDD5B